MTEQEIGVTVPELPEFDNKIFRKAVRSVIARTVFWTLIVVTVGPLLLEITTGVVSTRGGREERFGRFMDGALALAYPGYELNTLCCRRGRALDLWTRNDLRPRQPFPAEVGIKLDLRQNAFGRLDPADASVRIPTGRLGGVLLPAPEKPATRRLLTHLPKAIVVSVAVELSAPVGPSGFREVAERFNLRVAARASDWVDPTDTPIILTPNDAITRSTRFPFTKIRHLVWPNADLAQFQRWARQLRTHDDHNLSALGLPSSAEIKRFAREGKVYGFVLERISPARLLKLLEDPLVKGIGIEIVEFALNPNARED